MAEASRLCLQHLQRAFYEEVPFHPERLLQNLADIFGGRTPQGSDVYYTPVKQ